MVPKLRRKTDSLFNTFRFDYIKNDFEIKIVSNSNYDLLLHNF